MTNRTFQIRGNLNLELRNAEVTLKHSDVLIAASQVLRERYSLVNRLIMEGKLYQYDPIDAAIVSYSAADFDHSYMRFITDTPTALEVETLQHCAYLEKTAEMFKAKGD